MDILKPNEDVTSLVINPETAPVVEDDISEIS